MGLYFFKVFYSSYILLIYIIYKIYFDNMNNYLGK